MKIKNYNLTFVIYTITILTITSLVLKLTCLGEKQKYISSLGIQYLPKHFTLYYSNTIKRFSFSCWLFGMWFDFPRKFKV